MAPLPNPLAPARTAGRLFSGAVALATAPARGALAFLEGLLDGVSGMVPPVEPPPDAEVPAAEPAFGPDADLDPDAARPAPVTPTVARVPSARRRRTRLRDPGPPAVLPGLFEASGEPWAAGPGEGLPEALRGDAQDVAPIHVDAGETLVAEVADPGAENGAGAELHVVEPWPSYDALSAADVVDRLAAQDSAALSVLLLYERAHRGRKTVLDAAARELARRD